MLLGLGLAPAVAGAQGQTTPPAPRQGLVVGFGLGGGHVELDCVDCGDVIEAASGDFHIGGMLTPRLALMFDGWSMVAQEDFLTASHTITTAAAQYWVLPRLWIKGGLGIAQARWRWDGIFVDLEDETKVVPGMMLGAGYELLVKGSFALDVQLRYGTGFYSEEEDDTFEVKAHNVAVQVGFNWY